MRDRAGRSGSGGYLVEPPPVASAALVRQGGGRFETARGPGVSVVLARVALLLVAFSVVVGCQHAEEVVEATLTAKLQQVLAERLGGNVRIARADFDSAANCIRATSVEFESEQGDLRGQADELLIALSPSQLHRIESAAVELRGAEVWVRGTLPAMRMGHPGRALARLPELQVHDTRLHWTSTAGSIDAQAVVAVLSADPAHKRVFSAQLQAVSWAAGQADAHTKLQPHVLASSMELHGELGQGQPLSLEIEVAGLSLPRSAAHPFALQEGHGTVVLAAGDASKSLDADGFSLRGEVELDLAYLSYFAADEGQAVDDVLPLFLADRISLAGAFAIGRDRLDIAEGFAVTMPAPGRVGELLLSEGATKVAGTIDAHGDGELRLSDIQLAGDALSVPTGQLQLAWHNDGRPGLSRGRGELSLAQVRVADLQSHVGGLWGRLLSLPERASGKLLLQADATAAFAKNAPWQVRSELDLADVRVGPLRFERGHLQARHRIEPGRPFSTVLERLDLNASQGGSVSLLADSAHTLSVKARSVAVASLTGLQRTVLSASGTMGQRTDLQIALTRRGEHEQLAELWLGDGSAPDLRGCDEAESQELRLCGQFLDGQVLTDLALVVSRAAQPEVRGRVLLRGFDLGHLAAEDDGLLSQLGPVDGQLDLAPGSRLAPRSWQGQLTLDTAAWRLGPFHLRAAAPIVLPVADGRMQLAGVVLHDGAGQLPLHGFYDVAHGTYRLQGQGRFSAGELAERSEVVRAARGDVDVEVDLRTGKAPRVVCSPQGIHAHLRALGLPELHLSDVSGDLRWDGHGFRYERLRADVGDGELRVSGRSAQLSLDAAMDLQIDVHGVAIEPLRGLRVEFSAETNLAAQRSGSVPTLAGKVNVRRFDYERQVPFSRLMTLDEVIAASGKSAEKPHLAFDLRVEDGGAWRVRNAMLDIELTSPKGIQISGTDRKPSVAGELVAKRGRVRVHGDELKVERGRVRFTDPQRLAAAFEVQASAAAKRRADAQIQLDIAGDSDKFDMTLRCQATGPVPPEYRCHYRGADLACAGLPELARLWACER